MVKSIQIKLVLITNNCLGSAWLISAWTAKCLKCVHFYGFDCKSTSYLQSVIQASIFFLLT